MQTGIDRPRIFTETEDDANLIRGDFVDRRIESLQYDSDKDNSQDLAEVGEGISRPGRLVTLGIPGAGFVPF